MDGISDRWLFGIAVAFYAAATARAVQLWRRGFSSEDWWCYLLLGAGFIPNTGALMARGFSLQQCPVTNLYETVVFISWTVGACHLVAGAWSRLRFLCALAAPLLLGLGIFGLQPGLDRPAPETEFTRQVVSLHVSFVLMAYGTFGLGAVAAVLYLVQEHDLKFHKVRAVLSRLPSMERLEKVVTQSLIAGLGLLSVGLLLSYWLVREKTGVQVKGDPKVIWSFLVWGAYAALLAMRLRLRWRARSVAWGALASFTFVMLTFWGTNLLSPLHHH